MLRSPSNKRVRQRVGRRISVTYTLYWSRYAGSLAPLCLLIESGVPYETVQIDTRLRAHKEEGYIRDVHPLGTVPALCLPDGRVLLESGAMILHLADLAPGFAPETGSKERPAFLDWVLYGAATLYPTCQRIHQTEGIVPDEAARHGTRQWAIEALDRSWDVVERALSGSGPFLFGARPSGADVYLAMLALWHPEPARFADAYPKTEAMKGGVLDLRSMRRALDLHGIG